MKSPTRHSFQSGQITVSYLAAGPPSGPLLILVHGWPGIAETWKRQMETFASLGFYVIAYDTRGYGESTVSKTIADYALEPLVGDALKLLVHLERREAIWIGHDWGSGIVWSLAAHHPEVCKAVINLAVPYHTLEYGLPYLETLIDRETYPKDTYPHGQWDYQLFYETSLQRANDQLETNVPNALKVCYAKANPANYGKPASQSHVMCDGGRYGGADQAPDLPLSATVFDQDPQLLQTVSDAMSKTGFYGASAYYLNHEANAAYSKKSLHGGYLNMPCLFLEAQHDPVCNTRLSRLGEPMRHYCCDLTEVSIEAAHWLQLEKPEDVNAAIIKWLVTRAQDWWPGFWRTPLISRSS